MSRIHDEFLSDEPSRAANERISAAVGPLLAANRQSARRSLLARLSLALGSALAVAAGILVGRVETPRRGSDDRLAHHSGDDDLFELVLLAESMAPAELDSVASVSTTESSVDIELLDHLDWLGAVGDDEWNRALQSQENS